MFPIQRDHPELFSKFARNVGSKVLAVEKEGNASLDKNRVETKFLSEVR